MISGPRRGVAGLTILIVVLTQAANGWTACTQPLPPSPKVGHSAPQIPEYARRNLVDVWADKIMTISDVPGSGYGNLSVVHDGGSINIWWKGAVPGAVQQQVDLARSAGLNV
jgi:hypothetical protein